MAFLQLQNPGSLLPSFRRSSFTQPQERARSKSKPKRLKRIPTIFTGRSDTNRLRLSILIHSDGCSSVKLMGRRPEGLPLSTLRSNRCRRGSTLRVRSMSRLLLMKTSIGVFEESFKVVVVLLLSLTRPVVFRPVMVLRLSVLGLMVGWLLVVGFLLV